MKKPKHYAVSNSSTRTRVTVDEISPVGLPAVITLTMDLRTALMLLHMTGTAYSQPGARSGVNPGREMCADIFYPLHDVLTGGGCRPSDFLQGYLADACRWTPETLDPLELPEVRNSFRVYEEPV